MFEKTQPTEMHGEVEDFYNFLLGLALEEQNQAIMYLREKLCNSRAGKIETLQKEIEHTRESIERLT